jgi:hypothetical protein
MKLNQLISRKFAPKIKYSMKDLRIEASENSPVFSFQANGILHISGRVLPEPDALFWGIANDWLANYIETKPNRIILRLQFDCVNTSSSLEILKLLYLIGDVKNKEISIDVYWYYPINDIQLEEMGKDFQELLPFKFIFEAIETEENVFIN